MRLPTHPMRRSTVALLLSLLLVFVQHGAVRHALGHLSHPDRTSGATLDVAPAADQAPCGACEGFTQVASPAFGATASHGIGTARPALTPSPVLAAAARDPLTPRSRGPPSA